MAVSAEEREKLFRQLRHSLGAPIRQIELTDEQLLNIDTSSNPFYESSNLSSFLNIPGATWQTITEKQSRDLLISAYEL